jgi:hypothetical protein
MSTDRDLTGQAVRTLASSSNAAVSRLKDMHVPRLLYDQGGRPWWPEAGLHIFWWWKNGCMQGLQGKPAPDLMTRRNGGLVQGRPEDGHVLGITPVAEAAHQPSMSGMKYRLQPIVREALLQPCRNMSSRLVWVTTALVTFNRNSDLAVVSQCMRAFIATSSG